MRSSVVEPSAGALIRRPPSCPHVSVSNPSKNQAVPSRCRSPSPATVPPRLRRGYREARCGKATTRGSERHQSRQASPGGLAPTLRQSPANSDHGSPSARARSARTIPPSAASRCFDEFDPFAYQGHRLGLDASLVRAPERAELLASQRRGDVRMQRSRCQEDAFKSAGSASTKNCGRGNSTRSWAPR